MRIRLKLRGVAARPRPATTLVVVVAQLLRFFFPHRTWTQVLRVACTYVCHTDGTCTRPVRALLDAYTVERSARVRLQNPALSQDEAHSLVVMGLWETTRMTLAGLETRSSEGSVCA